MSNHLISMVYKRQLGSGTRKALMALLADKASDDGRGIWASKQTMADELCITKRAVIITINGLIADGILSCVGERKCETGHTIEYAIEVERLEALPLVGCWEKRSKNASSSEPRSPVNDVHRCTTFTGRGERRSPKPPLEPITPILSDESIVPKPESCPDGSESEPESGGKSEILKPSHVVEAWNALARRKGLPAVKHLTESRLKQIRSRIARHSIDDFTEAISAIERSDWLCGDNDRGWRADFDFFIQQKSFTKLIEGGYGS